MTASANRLERLGARVLYFTDATSRRFCNSLIAVFTLLVYFILPSKSLCHAYEQDFSKLFTFTSSEYCVEHPAARTTRSDSCLHITSPTMADDLEEGEDERRVELVSLAAIYPELVIDTVGSDPFSATISIQVEPVKPLSIRFPSAEGAPPTRSLTPPLSIIERTAQLELGEDGVAVPTNEDISRLSHLPALNLRLSLPEGYPAEKPPLFFLESQYSWLPEPKLQELRKAGHTLWEELGRDQVVFSYIDHLREVAERGFDMAQAEDQVLEISPDLKVSLLDFDLKAKRAKFERETFECGICLGK